MQISTHSTLVKSFIGRRELRQVIDVDEWRVERTVDDEAVVVTLTSAEGYQLRYRLSATDAQDISEVLSRLMASGKAI